MAAGRHFRRRRETGATVGRPRGSSTDLPPPSLPPRAPPPAPPADAAAEGAAAAVAAAAEEPAAAVAATLFSAVAAAAGPAAAEPHRRRRHHHCRRRRACRRRRRRRRPAAPLLPYTNPEPPSPPCPPGRRRPAATAEPAAACATAAAPAAESSRGPAAAVLTTAAEGFRRRAAAAVAAVAAAAVRARRLRCNRLLDGTGSPRRTLSTFGGQYFTDGVTLMEDQTVRRALVDAFWIDGDLGAVGRNIAVDDNASIFVSGSIVDTGDIEDERAEYKEAHRAAKKVVTKSHPGRMYTRRGELNKQESSDQLIESAEGLDC